MPSDDTAPLTPEERARLADLISKTPPSRPLPSLTPEEAGELRDIADRFLASDAPEREKAEFIRRARSAHTQVLGPVDDQEPIEDLQHVRQRLDEIAKP